MAQHWKPEAHWLTRAVSTVTLFAYLVLTRSRQYVTDDAIGCAGSRRWLVWHPAAVALILGPVVGVLATAVPGALLPVLLGSGTVAAGAAIALLAPRSDRPRDSFPPPRRPGAWVIAGVVADPEHPGAGMTLASRLLQQVIPTGAPVLVRPATHRHERLYIRRYGLEPAGNGWLIGTAGEPNQEAESRT